MKKLAIFCVLGLVAACGSDDGGGGAAVEDDGSGEFGIDVVAGKADIVDLATPATLGAAVSGSVTETSVALFKVDVEARDEVELRVQRTSGDFDPRSGLFRTTGSEIKHDQGSFARIEGGNTKRFTMESGGTYLLAVRSHRSRGAGEFKLTASCVGGACAGEPIISGTDATDAGVCIGRARRCAFGKLSGAAQTDVAGLLKGCLPESSGTGIECEGACDHNDDSKALCGQITEALGFYHGQAAECAGVVGDCLEACTEMEENSPYLEEDEFEFNWSGEAICWIDPEYNGTCDEVARTSKKCGGDSAVGQADESWGDCMAWCGATSGAWLSDVDEVCEPDCLYICEEVDAGCDTECGFDDPLPEDEGESDAEFERRTTCKTACIDDSDRAKDGCEYIR